MRFVSEDILIIFISAQAVIPPNAASPVWAHYLCHKNTISMIITGFTYKLEHKASVLKISRGRRGREKFNKSYRSTKLPSLILQLLFPQKSKRASRYKITGLFIKNSRLVQELEWWRTQNFLHSETFLMEIWFLLYHVVVHIQGRERLSKCLPARVYHSPSEHAFQRSHFQQKLKNLSMQRVFVYFVLFVYFIINGQFPKLTKPISTVTSSILW